MIQMSDIKPLTDFLRNSKAHIEHLKSSGNPELLTVNGEATVVVQDAESYEKMAALARQARDDERLREGLDRIRSGEHGEDMYEAFAKLRAKHFKSG